MSLPPVSRSSPDAGPSPSTGLSSSTTTDAFCTSSTRTIGPAPAGMPLIVTKGAAAAADLAWLLLPLWWRLGGVSSTQAGSSQQAGAAAVASDAELEALPLLLPPSGHLSVGCSAGITCHAPSVGPAVIRWGCRWSTCRHRGMLGCFLLPWLRLDPTPALQLLLPSLLVALLKSEVISAGPCPELPARSLSCSAGCMGRPC